MFFSADLANLLFYCAQQLGVTLGVGAETIMLAAYLISMRDGVVDEKETQYARAIKRAMSMGLWLIILSGIGITVLHIMAGQGSTVTEPAFLFKWLLVLLVVALTFLRKAYPVSLVEGVIGGTWYALFLVHILAPVTSWINLATLYAVLLVGFVMCWEVLVLIKRDKKISPPIRAVKKEEPVIIVEAQPAPKPFVSQPHFEPKIVLDPDLPHKPLSMPTPVPPPPAPAVTTAPVTIKEEKITMDSVFPNEPTVPSPAGKVTDTPFLPSVPALQPIPTPLPEVPPAQSKGEPAATTVPTTTPPPPVTTMPGGTSTPSTTSPSILVQDGLSAMNVMPKNPSEVMPKQ